MNDKEIVERFLGRKIAGFGKEPVWEMLKEARQDERRKLEAENAGLKARWDKLEVETKEASVSSKYEVVRKLMGGVLERMHELESGGDANPVQDRLGTESRGPRESVGESGYNTGANSPKPDSGGETPAKDKGKLGILDGPEPSSPSSGNGTPKPEDEYVRKRIEKGLLILDPGKPREPCITMYERKKPKVGKVKQG